MARVFSEDDFAPAPPKKPRVFSDSDFVTAPGHADVVAPKVEAKPAGESDDYAHPGEFATDIQGLGEGIGLGPIARRITAAGRTYLLPNALGGNDLSYDENVKREEDRRTGAATDHPLRYAASSTAGNAIGAFLNPTAYTALAGANGAIETKGGLADKALGAASEAGLAYVGSRLARAAPRLAGATFAGLGGLGAAESAAAGAPLGDTLASIGSGLLGGRAALSGHAAKSREGADLGRQRVAAEGDLRVAKNEDLNKAGQKRAAAERAAIADVEKQRGQAEKQTMARVGAADSADAADLSAAQGVNRDVNKAHGAQVGQNVEMLREQNRREQEARATTDDAQQRVHNDAKAELSRKKIEESYANRLARVNHGDEFAKAQADYEIAKEAHEAAVQSAKDLESKAKAHIDRSRAVQAEFGKMKAEHEKALTEVADQMKDLGENIDPESVDASILGKLGEMFRESHTRLSNLIAGGDRNGIKVPDEYRALDKMITETLLKNSPRKFVELQEYARDKNAWWEKQRDAFAKEHTTTGAPQAKVGPAAPTADDAAKVVDDRAQAKTADALAYDAEMAAEKKRLGHVDPGAAPERPNDAAWQQHLRDVERAKLEVGPTPLPPKPDRLATRGVNREASAALRQDVATAPGDVSRQEIADNRTGAQPNMRSAQYGSARSDPGLIVEKRAPLTPAAGPARPIDRAMEDAVNTGRGNALGHLADTTKRSIPEQMGRERDPSTLRQAISRALPVAMGVGAGALGLSGGAGGAAGAGGVGALAGHALGKKIAPPREDVLSGRYLQKSPSMAGVEPGGDAVERYSKPGEATAILRDAEGKAKLDAITKELRAGRLARSSLGAVHRLTPAVLEWIRRKREEESAR